MTIIYSILHSIYNDKLLLAIINVFLFAVIVFMFFKRDQNLRQAKKNTKALRDSVDNYERMLVDAAVEHRQKVEELKSEIDCLIKKNSALNGQYATLNLKYLDLIKKMKS